MSISSYNLERAFQLRDFFISPNPTKNLFYYRTENEEWLKASEKTVALLLRLKEALDAANFDEARIREERILNRAERLAQMMLDDIMCAIYCEDCAVGATNCRGMIRTGSLVVRSQQPEEAQAAHQDELKEEAKGAIKDVSIASIPYKGLVRRLFKLKHNVEVIDRLVDERLYVPASLIRSNITDMVFKGVWHGDTQSVFNRIMKTFVFDRLWSVRGQNKKAEWERIISETQTVSDRPGRVFLDVVEASLSATGIAA